MVALILDSTLSPQTSVEGKEKIVIEEIEGLIRVYQDGHIERPQIVPTVTCTLPPSLGVTSRDITIDKLTSIWARFYVPNCHHHGRDLLPLLVYFHGGGFCVGSASWSCYHEFLARLSAEASCVIVSVDYRLAPENPLPAAYDDGLKALMFVKQQSLSRTNNNTWWSSKCDFASIFLGGDSAGANIAFSVAAKLGSKEACQNLGLWPLSLKGTVLVQPFFGGESRTQSEEYSAQPPRSALTLAASDTYWRLALPPSANRDHPWCNPVAKGVMELERLKLLPSLVCSAEMDILRDRTLELCDALARAGQKVHHVMFESVGHAFQILSKSEVAQKRTTELISLIKSFIIIR